MSRTIRNLPTDRRRLKWYEGYHHYAHENLQLLRNPPERANTDRVYVYKEEERVYSYYIQAPRGEPGKRVEMWDYEQLSSQWDGKRWLPALQEGDRYVKRTYTKTVKWRELVQSHNMKCMKYEELFRGEEEEAKLEVWTAYKIVHRYVHRNGTCRRQRKNAVRLEKQGANQNFRTRTRRLIRQEVFDYYAEEPEEFMPSQSTRRRIPENNL